MQPMYVSIQQKETGNRIKSLLKQNGYTVKDIQGAMGFENPQAVYKWLSGRSLPSIDNFIILSRLLHTSIEDILVIDGDIVRLWSCYLIFYKNQPFFEKNIPACLSVLWKKQMHWRHCRKTCVLSVWMLKISAICSLNMK